MSNEQLSKHREAEMAITYNELEFFAGLLAMTEGSSHVTNPLCLLCIPFPLFSSSPPCYSIISLI